MGLAWILAFGKGHDENPIDRFVTAMIAFGPGVWLIHYALKHAITLYRITQEGELTTGVVTGVSTGFNYYFMHQVRYNYTVDGGTHLKGMITSQDYPIGARVIVAYPPENPREGRCIDNLIRSPT